MTVLDKRGLPCAPDCERFVLGSLLLYGDMFHVARTALEPEDFHGENHRRIWDAMCSIYDAGGTADRVTLAHELSRREQLESVGGLGYTNSLDDGLPETSNLDGYIQILKDKAILRRVIRTCAVFEDRAATAMESPQVLLDDLSQAVISLAPAELTKDPTSVQKLVEDRGLNHLLAPRREKGLRLPLPSLDRALCGFQAGQMILLAAHTSCGKTSLALQIAAHVAKQAPVVYFSREMEKDRLFRRMVNQRARIDSDKQRHGALNAEERARQAEAADRLYELPIYLDEQSATIPAIHAAVRRVRLQKPVGLVVVDYLQLLRSVGKYESRAKEVGACSRALKQAAMEFGIPFLVLSQFSRDSLKAGRRPELHDLKESGDIENDSDVVLLIWPEQVPEAQSVKPIIIRVAKQREGPRNIDLKMLFMSQYQRFEEEAGIPCP